METQAGTSDTNLVTTAVNEYDAARMRATAT